MGAKTAISWCDSTFNPFIGCTKVSPGCAHCYAETMDRRWGKDRWGPGKPRTRTSPAYWRQPLAWNKAAEKAGVRHRVFCASMADVFDAEVPDAWRIDLLDLIRRTPHLDWLLLTKRPENIRGSLEVASDPGDDKLDPDRDDDQALTLRWLDRWLNGDAPDNVWLGTTAEDQPRANERIPLLLKVPAAVRFLSCEPLLGPLDLSRWIPSGLIDWAIVGGESGPKARPFNVGWARSLIAQCKAAGVPVFFKQLGSQPRGFCHSSLYGDSDQQRDEEFCDMYEASEGPGCGRCIAQPKGPNADPEHWPEDLRVREFPKERR